MSNIFLRSRSSGGKEMPFIFKKQDKKSNQPNIQMSREISNHSVISTKDNSDTKSTMSRKSTHSRKSSKSNNTKCSNKRDNSADVSIISAKTKEQQDQQNNYIPDPKIKLSNSKKSSKSPINRSPINKSPMNRSKISNSQINQSFDNSQQNMSQITPQQNISRISEQESKSEMTDLRCQVKNLEGKVNKLVDSHDNENMKYEEIKAQNNFLREKLDKFSNNFNRVQSEFDKCKHEFHSKETLLLRNASEKDAMISKLEKDKTVMKENLNQLTYQNKFQNKDTFDQLVNKYEQLNKENEHQISHESSQASQEIKSLKAKVTKQESDIHQYKNKLSVLDQVEVMIDSLRGEVKDQSSSINKKNMKIRELEKENGKLNSVIKEMEVKLNNSNKNYNCLQDEFDKLNQGKERNHIIYQNAFNQTPMYLLNDPKIQKEITQFKLDSNACRSQSIETNTSKFNDYKNTNVNLLRESAEQYSVEISNLKNDFEEIVRKVNSVQNQTFEGVDELKDFLTQTTQSTIQNIMGTLGSLNLMEPINDKDAINNNKIPLPYDVNNLNLTQNFKNSNESFQDVNDILNGIDFGRIKSLASNDSCLRDGTLSGNQSLTKGEFQILKKDYTNHDMKNVIDEVDTTNQDQNNTNKIFSPNTTFNFKPKSQSVKQSMDTDQLLNFKINQVKSSGARLNNNQDSNEQCNQLDEKVKESYNQEEDKQSQSPKPEVFKANDNLLNSYADLKDHKQSNQSVSPGFTSDNKLTVSDKALTSSDLKTYRSNQSISKDKPWLKISDNNVMSFNFGESVDNTHASASFKSQADPSGYDAKLLTMDEIQRNSFDENQESDNFTIPNSYAGFTMNPNQYTGQNQVVNEKQYNDNQISNIGENQSSNIAIPQNDENVENMESSLSTQFKTENKRQIKDDVKANSKSKSSIDQEISSRNQTDLKNVLQEVDLNDLHNKN